MPVDQFIFTHCTYASSFLERRDGDDAGLPMGYGPRSSSLPVDRLRDVLQGVERYLYYNLPLGTPPEERLVLNAETAPCRLVYLPDLGGLEVAVRVCYRQTDTSGRPGSFFSHALVRDPGGGRSAWEPCDVVRLWDATTLGNGDVDMPFWISGDAASIPFDLPGLGSLETLGAAVRSRPIGDDLLGCFLQATDETDFEDPLGVIPDRWKRRPVEQRRQFLDQLVSGFVASLDRDVSLLLVADPPFAALLFYAVMRILAIPSVIPRTAFSFSTYEHDPNRLLTRLAALPLPAGDVLSEGELRVDHVILDTHVEPSTGEGECVAEKALVALVLHEFDEGGWPRVDRAIDTISVLAPESLQEVERLVAAYRGAERLVEGELEVSEDRGWEGEAKAVALFEREVHVRLVENPERPEAWYGSPSHVECLEILGTREFGALDDDVQQVIQSLMAKLVDNDTVGVVLSLLQSTRLLSEYRAWLVCRVMQQSPGEPLSDVFGFLWEASPEDAGADHVLAGVVDRWMSRGNARYLKAVCESVPDGRLPVLLSVAAHGVRGREYKSELKGDLDAWAEKGQQAMKVVLQQVSDVALCEFLNGPYAMRALQAWPKCDGELEERLRALAGGLAAHPDEFNARISALERASAWGRENHERVADWKILAEGLSRMVRTETKRIDREEFVEFRRASRRLKLFRWRDSGRMKNLVRGLDKIARVTSVADEEPSDLEPMVKSIEPGLLLVGMDWSDGQVTWDEFASYDYGDRFARRFPVESQQIRKGLENGDFRYRAAWDPRGWSSRVKLASVFGVSVLVLAAVVTGLFLWKSDQGDDSGAGRESTRQQDDEKGEGHEER